MDTRTIVAAGLGVMLLGGVAVAQNAAPPPPPGGPGAPGMEAEHGPEHDGMMRGHHGFMHHRMWERMHGEMPPPPPPPSRAASFRFRKGDSSVMIRCAENEPTKACTDAATVLLDKLAAQPR